MPGARVGTSILPGGRFTAASLTLKGLIAYAFDVRDFQIEGGPPWLTSDYFEVNAIAGADASQDDVRRMLRTLLAERFGLRTRIETRQAPVHVLILARSDGRWGPGLKRTTPECERQLAERKAGKISSPPAFNPDAPVPVCGVTAGVRSPNGASKLLLGGMELTALVRSISSELSAPVIDRTGLSGLFDITLEFMTARSIAGRAPGLDANSTDPLPLPIDAALPAQLGLRLEKEIGPLPVVLVDAATPPTVD